MALAGQNNSLTRPDVSPTTEVLAVLKCLNEDILSKITYSSALDQERIGLMDRPLAYGQIFGHRSLEENLKITLTPGG